MQLTTITDETRLAWANLADRATGIVTPSVRLGVTGLARAGKTVFIAALVHNLVHGGRLPLFKAYAGGRVAGARLEPQPDDAVPRFDYERHVRALVEERLWPDSTRQISELRLTVAYEFGVAADPHHRQRPAATSTSSTIPANGCSTCRCSPRATPNGRARRLPPPAATATATMPFRG